MLLWLVSLKLFYDCGRLTGCSVVGLADTLEVLVCCIWKWIVDNHDSGMSMSLFLPMVLSWSRTCMASFTWRVQQSRSLAMNWTPLMYGRCSVLLSLSCQFT